MLTHIGTLFAMGRPYRFLTHCTRLWHGLLCVCALEMFHVEHIVKQS